MRGPRRQRGFALMMVLVLVAVATVLALGYLSSSTVRQLGTNNLFVGMRAQYVAESGLQHGLWLLRRDPDAMEGSQANPLGPFQLDESEDSYRFWAVQEGGPSSQVWTLSAEGTASGATRLASVKVKFIPRYEDTLEALGPLSHWRLGDSHWIDWARDSAGSNNGRYENGTQHDEDGALPHDPNSAATFDGANDYVDLREMDISGSAMTLLAWFKTDDWDRRDARIISKADGTRNRDQYWTLSTKRSGGDCRLQFRLKTDGNTHKLTADAGDIQAGEWTFAAATYDGSKMKLYQGGVFVGQRNKSGGIDTDPSVAAWIGGNPDDPGAKPWDGQIDEVAVFERALEPEEIESLFKARLPDVEFLSWND